MGQNCCAVTNIHRFSNFILKVWTKKREKEWLEWQHFVVVVVVVVESTIVAAQDETISTNQFKNKILKEEIESKCRLCKQHE